MPCLSSEHTERRDNSGRNIEEKIDTCDTHKLLHILCKSHTVEFCISCLISFFPETGKGYK